MECNNNYSDSTLMCAIKSPLLSNVFHHASTDLLIRALSNCLNQFL